MGCGMGRGVVRLGELLGEVSGGGSVLALVRANGMGGDGVHSGLHGRGVVGDSGQGQLGGKVG